MAVLRAELQHPRLEGNGVLSAGGRTVQAALALASRLAEPLFILRNALVVLRSPVCRHPEVALQRHASLGEFCSASVHRAPD